MSSINRRRNGLMALSVIGAPVLGAVFSPSISRQDACFCYSPRPFPCYKLPRERFSPSAHLPRCGAVRQRPANRTHSCRSGSGAGTALHAPRLTFTTAEATSRSGWKRETRWGGAGSDSLQAHRHGEIAAELLGKVDRDTGMDAASAVEELGMVVDRDDGAVPEIRMDVEPALAVAPEAGEFVGGDIVSRERERHHKALATQRIEELAAVGVIV